MVQVTCIGIDTHLSLVFCISGSHMPFTVAHCKRGFFLIRAGCRVCLQVKAFRRQLLISVHHQKWATHISLVPLQTSLAELRAHGTSFPQSSWVLNLFKRQLVTFNFITVEILLHRWEYLIFCIVSLYSSRLFLNLAASFLQFPCLIPCLNFPPSVPLFTFFLPLSYSPPPHKLTPFPSISCFLSFILDTLYLRVAAQNSYQIEQVAGINLLMRLKSPC